MNSNRTFSSVPYVFELTLMHGGEVLLSGKKGIYQMKIVRFGNTFYKVNSVTTEYYIPARNSRCFQSWVFFDQILKQSLFFCIPQRQSSRHIPAKEMYKARFRCVEKEALYITGKKLLSPYSERNHSEAESWYSVTYTQYGW